MKISEKKTFKISVFGKIQINQGWDYWLKLFLVMMLVNLGFGLLFSQIILKEKIFIPSIYGIIQGISYIYEEFNLPSNTYFNINLLIFFSGVFLINIPLLIFSYYKINKEFTKRSLINLFSLLLVGLVISTNLIQNFLKEIELKLQIDTLANKIKDVRYYLIIFLTALCFGLLLSFIWKNEMSGGGLDFIYTYLATKTRIKIQWISIPINFVFVSIALIMTFSATGEKFDLQTVILLMLGSLFFGYITISTVNYFYPKFVLVNLWIVTKKGKTVLPDLRKKYNRGGFVIAVKGLYNNQNLQVISTSLTYIELKSTIDIVRNIDKKAFFIVNPVSKIYGPFKFKH